MRQQGCEVIGCGEAMDLLMDESEWLCIMKEGSGTNGSVGMAESC